MVFLYFVIGILGDPGTVSGGRKKFLTFLCPNFFLARVDFFLLPLSALGSPAEDAS